MAATHLIIFIACCATSVVTSSSNSAVTDIVISAITASSARVSWTLPASPENITKYELVYGSNQVTIDDTSTISYDLNELDFWTMYETCVKSILNDDSTVKSCSTFTTSYTPVNKFVFAAVGCAAFLIIMLIIAVIIESRFQTKIEEERAAKKKFTSKVKVGII
ncbi:uncharacterized protein LOC144432915 [Glandiceps talaboti]